VESVRRVPMTVIEIPDFIMAAERLIDDAEREELVAFVATNPEAGDVVPETGGVRKLRWGLSGRGKRGGARVIYYYHDEQVPILMLDMYPKNAKANLTKAERNAMRKRIPELIRTLQRRRK
jgi:mRNA-degrading endonuclease RelE of RelBE toxin-antitoxin system